MASRGASPVRRASPPNPVHGGPSTHPDSPPIRKRTYPEAFGLSDGPSPYLPRAADALRPEDDRAELEREEAAMANARERVAPRSRHHPATDYEDHDPGAAAAAAATAAATAAAAAAAAAAQPYYSRQATHDADRQLAEALQRETNAGGPDSVDGGVGADGSPGGEEGYGSPGDDDDLTGPPYGDYGAPRPSSAGAGGVAAYALESERKRRKRVFSNRTKTGCLTCRKRKKKCDEQHPECE